MKREILLIVDDSELDLAVLSVIFKDTFNVKCVTNARDAMEFILLNYKRICAVLLDICLGEKGSGLNVLAEIKQSNDICDLPVFLITTDAKEDYVLQGIHQGACDFLVKPVDPNSVKKRVCEKIKSIWAENKKEDFEYENTILLSTNIFSFEAAECVTEKWLQQMNVLCESRKVFSVDKYKRIQKITTILAKAYIGRHKENGLNEEDAMLIGQAATFYDIGLMGLPDAIIEGGEMQEEPERSIYFKHITLGRDFFIKGNKEQPFLKYCADIAYWHHKNYNGTGYPIEADGDDIPICAQLVRTALLFDENMEYYKGMFNFEDKVIVALRKEVGNSISSEMYQTVVQAKSELSKIVNKMYLEK